VPDPRRRRQRARLGGPVRRPMGAAKRRLWRPAVAGLRAGLCGSQAALIQSLCPHVYKERQASTAGGRRGTLG
jgi:hypothetical protein